jgi:hypothetical protein
MRWITRRARHRTSSDMADATHHGGSAGHR